MVVNDSQSTFLPGKIIHDNIMLAQEQVKGYGRKGISARCTIQMDIRKAYDSVEWPDLEVILVELGFPHVFVHWILVCVKTVSYKFLVNGNQSQLVCVKRGLRQGDPISPLPCFSYGILAQSSATT